MITFKKLYEDSQDAGYPGPLETPRELGHLDYSFVAINAGRYPGEEVLDADKKPIKGSAIIRNDLSLFQYAHLDGNEVHIESVEMDRNLWNQIHIPKSSKTIVGNLK